MDKVREAVECLFGDKLPTEGTMAVLVKYALGGPIQNKLSSRATSAHGRLYNWKFAQTARKLEACSPEAREAVEALSSILGNPGWAVEGDLGILVNAVCENICEGYE